MRLAPGHYDGDGCTFPSPGHLLPDVPMRVLSVRQPWALHIMQSGKDVENRSQNLGPYRGPIAIHASKTEDAEAMARLPMRALNGIPRIFDFGVILGTVDLVDIHDQESCLHNISGIPDEPEMDSCSQWAEYSFGPGVFHLVLENPRALAPSDRIPFKGGLGLRVLPADVETELLRRLA